VLLLVFLSAWLLPGRKWVPDAKHLVLGGGIMLLVMAYAYVISRLTEYRTDQVRRVVMGWLKERLLFVMLLGWLEIIALRLLALTPK
jgi:hypothetical protein